MTAGAPVSPVSPCYWARERTSVGDSGDAGAWLRDAGFAACGSGDTAGTRGGRMATRPRRRGSRARVTSRARRARVGDRCSANIEASP
jgi:hypothetical protein